MSHSTLRDHKRYAIVKEALAVACFDGWNEATITKAAVKAGLPALEGRRLFPDGVAEVFSCYAEMVDSALLEKAAAANLSSMRVHERVAWLLRTRLELIAPHKEAIRRAVSLMAMPWHHGKLIRSVWDVSDMIWQLAGDSSTDFNYYTKRTLLMQVYASTILFWLNDDSPNTEASWEFLDRRIQDVLKMGKQIGKTRASVSASVEGLMDQLLNRQKYRTKR